MQRYIEIALFAKQYFIQTMVKRIFLLILFVYAFDANAQFVAGDSMVYQSFRERVESSLIIGLGEESHGFESVNTEKAKLLIYLKNEFDLNAVLFESSLVESVISFLSEDMPGVRPGKFLYPYWNTPSVRSLITEFIQGEDSKGLPLIAGFDIQEDCRFNVFSNYLIQQNIVTNQLKALNICDSILSLYIGKKNNRKSSVTNEEYQILSGSYELIEAEINLSMQDLLKKKLLLYCIENRKSLCKYLTINAVNERMHFRDSLMAANIIWFQQELYTGKQFAIWAANTHIAKQRITKNIRWTGERLAAYFDQHYLPISIQKGSAKNSYTWENIFFYFNHFNSKGFEYIFYTGEIQKVMPHEWITHCD